MVIRQAPKDTTSEKPKKELPINFKVSRDALMQMPAIERDIFKGLEDNRSGNYVTYNIPEKVSLFDLKVLNLALAKILYNQSYQYGNEDINSGLERTEEGGEAWKEINGYRGVIETSLNDICRHAYGVKPDNKTKKKMAALIESASKIEVTMNLYNGDKLKSKLFFVYATYERKADGATLYKLFLNPLFGSRIKNQFGLLPQDVIKQINQACKKKGQRKNEVHINLLNWLSYQDAKRSHTRSITNLANMLEMEEYFKKNISMAENKLLSACDIMVDIGILANYDVAYSYGSRKAIEKITFHMNKNYLRIPQIP